MSTTPEHRDASHAPDPTVERDSAAPERAPSRHAAAAPDVAGAQRSANASLRHAMQRAWEFSTDARVQVIATLDGPANLPPADREGLGRASTHLRFVTDLLSGLIDRIDAQP